MTDVTPIVLAAGRGRRLDPDCPKALAEVAGIPLLTHLLRRLGDALPGTRPRVVIGSGAGRIRSGHHDWDVEWCHNTNWHASDMYASLRIGAQRASGALLVCPVDCPLVSPPTLSALAAGPFLDREARRPVFANRSGHPVLLAGYTSRILTRPGPLRALVAEWKNLAVEDPAVCDNLNTPTALREAERRSTDCLSHRVE